MQNIPGENVSNHRKHSLNLLGRVAPSPKILFGIALVQQLLGSGIIFGWPSLQALMQSELVFSSSCSPEHLAAYVNEGTPCPEALKNFNMCFSFGANAVGS
jgi:hypothetical protein